MTAKVYSLRTHAHPDTQLLGTIRDDVAHIFAMLRSAKQKTAGHPVSDSELVPIDLQLLIRLLGWRYEELEELGAVRIENPWAERNALVDGMSNPLTRTISVAKRQERTQLRFTVAHEVGHAIYDSDIVRLRERAGRGPQDKSRERNADRFATELLMPAQPVSEAMSKRFGGAIDGTIPRDDLAHFISSGVHRTIPPTVLARMPQVRRAALFATADNFSGPHFKPLVERFDVSVETMAIRLLELELVA